MAGTCRSATGRPCKRPAGRPDAGEVYLWFTSDPLNWEGEVAATETPADNAHLGTSVATSGQWMVSGADRDIVLGPNSGSVSIYPAHNHFESYCTAGTSANGCQALMGATGIPSATAPSGGFVAYAHSGVPLNDGLFLYSTNGQQAVPWGGSTSFQCVVPPVVRTPVKKSSGTVGQCDGLATIDLNAFWGAVPAKNPGEGVINIQYWYRDTLNTSGTPTSLSNGLSVEVGP